MKKINLNHVNKYSNILLLVLAAFLFGLLDPRYTPDSVEYISYLDFFEGVKPFSQWPVRRGGVFPFLLWIGTRLSYNTIGISIILNIMFITMIYYFVRSLDLLMQIYKVTYKAYVLKFVAVMIFIILNPLIYGMYHMVLTDSISATLFVIIFYYVLKYYTKLTENRCRKKRLFYYALFVILTLIAWFLKQMFFTITCVLLFLILLLHLFQKRKKDALYIGITICSAFFVLFAMNGLSETDTKSETTSGFSLMILGGERYFEIEDYKMDDGNIFLNIPVKGNHKICVKDDTYNTIKMFEYNFKDGKTLDYIKYIFKCFQNAPYRFIKGYWDNVLLLCGFAERNVQDGVIRYQTGPVNYISIFDILTGNTSTSDKTTNWNISSENENLVLDYLKYQHNSDAYLSYYTNIPTWTERMEYFRSESDNEFVRNISKGIWSRLHLVIYALFTVSSLPCFLVSGIMLLRKHEDFIWYSVFLLSGFSFAHMMMLTMTGCVVDRYMFAVYVAQVLLYSILALNIFFIREKKKMQK